MVTAKFTYRRRYLYKFYIKVIKSNLIVHKVSFHVFRCSVFFVLVGFGCSAWLLPATKISTGIKLGRTVTQQ